MSQTKSTIKYTNQRDLCNFKLNQTNPFGISVYFKSSQENVYQKRIQLNETNTCPITYEQILDSNFTTIYFLQFNILNQELSKR